MLLQLQPLNWWRMSTIEYAWLKSDGDVSPVKHSIILGHECLVIAYISEDFPYRTNWDQKLIKILM